MSENLNPLSGPPDTRKSPEWAQVDRAAIEEWGKLMLVNARAASLLAFLVARMQEGNSVTTSQKTLGKLMGVHERTVRRALGDLVKGKWIQVVRLNGPGTVASYVVNAKVAWTQSRDKLRTATFYTTVIADCDDQEDVDSLTGELRLLPRLLKGEGQLPTGPGLPPPSEPALPGLEPDLPALVEEERYGEPVAIGQLVKSILPHKSEE
jgi:DNA-binding transcriptional regulator YhcF (GntR family)